MIFRDKKLSTIGASDNQILGSHNKIIWRRVLRMRFGVGINIFTFEGGLQENKMIENFENDT